MSFRLRKCLGPILIRDMELPFQAVSYLIAAAIIV